MMTDANIISIVQAVQRYDVDPPTEDYSSYDYGVSVAQGMSSPQALTSLVIESLNALPNGLAETFIEGVLAGATVPQLEEILIDAVPNVREVSSARVVVDLLLDECKASPKNLVARLLNGIRTIAFPEAQNRFAYAIYSAFRTNDRDERLPTNSDHEGTILEDLIEQLMSSVPLTDYARNTLESCIRRH